MKKSVVFGGICVLSVAIGTAVFAADVFLQRDPVAAEAQMDTEDDVALRLASVAGQEAATEISEAENAGAKAEPEIDVDAGNGAVNAVTAEAASQSAAACPNGNPDCPNVGYYDANGTHVCILCPNGNPDCPNTGYYDANGAHVCVACPNGNPDCPNTGYCDANGAHVCIACPNGNPNCPDAGYHDVNGTHTCGGYACPNGNPGCLSPSYHQGGCGNWGANSQGGGHHSRGHGGGHHGHR